MAGPICPVESDPPSPECAARSVEKAVIIILDVAGVEVARGITGTDGTVFIEVPTGQLTIIPQAVQGFLGTADSVTVAATASQRIQLSVQYDTGIR